MKILVLADRECKRLYDYYKPEYLEDIDLIISCGDLPAGYLSFFATMCHAPVLYVSGNHDHYKEGGLDGCICLEDRIYVYRGVRIMGLGGSMQYLPGAMNQYTEKAMCRRIRRMALKLLRYRGVDILVAHAPARNVNDLEDLPHQGFVCFRTFMEKYRPKVFLHGHIHANYGDAFKREDRFGDTIVINGYESYILEYPPAE